MTKRTSAERREGGQTLVLFVLCLAVLLGFVAMTIDVGLAYFERRNAQNAVDAGALAGALELSESGNPVAAIAEANDYLARHGYESSNSDIAVNIPPLSGPHTGNPAYVEVLVSTEEPAVFRAALNGDSWTIGARAVAGYDPASVPPYTFVSLRDDCENHTLLIQAGGTLTVNGGIYVNSCNGLDGSGKGSVPPGYGDGFDIFGKGGHIQAESVHVVGGWETHDGTTVSPDPLIHQPVLPDPYADVDPPDLSTLVVRNGTPSKPSMLKITSGIVTIQPGIYYGGISIQGTAKVTFADGIYVLGGGGLKVTNAAVLNAPHVMIYNTNAKPGGGYGEVAIDTSAGVILGAMTSGPYAGMTIFQDRLNTKDITLEPAAGLSGLSGTLYAAHDEATVVIRASGTANLQVVAGMINVVGADATFLFNPANLFNGGISLVE